jgi:hypothetical protein
MMAREGRILTFKERIVDKFKNSCCFSYDLFSIKCGVVVV